MALRIIINESSASRRAIPIWLVGSNGTTPATSESGNTFFFSIGGVDYGSGGSLSAVSAGGGQYTCNFATSKISVLGPGFVYYQSASALPSSTPIEVVPYDSYDSMRMGLFALPNAAPAAAGGLPTFGTGAGQLNLSSGSVGLIAVAMSGVTIQGLSNYSNATVAVATIVAGTYSGVTIDGATFLSPAGERSAASSLLSTNLGNSRILQDAFRILRNRVDIGASIMTVYQENDATSAWTASITTSASALPITSIDPAG